CAADRFRSPRAAPRTETRGPLLSGSGPFRLPMSARAEATRPAVGLIAAILGTERAVGARTGVGIALLCAARPGRGHVFAVVGRSARGRRRVETRRGIPRDGFCTRYVAGPPPAAIGLIGAIAGTEGIVAPIASVDIAPGGC